MVPDVVQSFICSSMYAAFTHILMSVSAVDQGLWCETTSPAALHGTLMELLKAIGHLFDYVITTVQLL